MSIKRTLFTLFALLLACLQVSAQTEQPIRKWWDFKYSTSYNSRWLRAFDENINPDAGGGYFLWIKTASNAAIRDIPGFQIKPVGTTKGYWRRADVSIMKVEWFGPNNLPSQATFGTYGYTQARLDSMYGYFGANWVLTTHKPDAAAIRTAFRLMETIGYNAVEFSPMIYYMDQVGGLPRILSGSLVSDKYQYTIIGNGAQITGLSGFAGSFFDRYPENHTVAATWIGAMFKITDFTFVGNAASGSGQTGIRLCATYNSEISNCIFKQIDVGFDLQWSMQAILIRNEGNQCRTADGYIRFGTYTGATNSGDQSNVVRVIGHRTFGGGGRYGIYISAASNVTIQDWTGEGGGADWGIYFDTNGSTVVKEFAIDNLYGEGNFDSAAVFIRGGEGIFDIRRVYFRGTVNLIWLQATGSYPQVNLTDVAYWESTMRLVSINLSGQTNNCWDITNLNKAGINTVADLINPANNVWNTTPAGSGIPGSNRCRVTPKIVN